MERDKLDGVATLARLASSRRRSTERSYGSSSRVRLAPDGPHCDIWRQISSDIAAFLAAMDSLSADDSDNGYEALLLATDRLLLASARTRLELQRVLSYRKERAAIHSASG